MFAIEAAVRADDVRELRCVGELDLAAQKPFVAAVSGMEPDACVLLHLGEVEFIDSTGVLCLLGLRRAVSRLVVCCISPPVGRVLDLTGLRDSFEIQGRRCTSAHSCGGDGGCGA
ncbi:STAS domain-containing protein [Conexibacter sp. W3-3-2]|uniref:STAS domain-containing protein n=1 Tax=Conexibacter sp. W3-3-2 TaxID=2675227 RepID=UPI0018A8CD08|nr:STAS domain-containing protein [Conexibacter sp. W3-3-2]